MSPTDFKKKIDEARYELEVRRIFHWFFEHVVGTQAELLDCIAYADARAMQLTEERQAA